MPQNIVQKKKNVRESFFPCCKCPPLENPSVTEASVMKKPSSIT